MVRPSPKSATGELDPEREALYGYLIGKEVAFERLPAEVRSYEAFKRHGGELPNVPFEMLTVLGLRVEQWAELARRMSFNQLRQGLNTLLRHGVFRDSATVELVASRLRDPERIKRSGTLPYQLLAAYTATASTMPNAITLALQEAMETAIVNVPRVSGKIYVCPDVSGSMHSAVTGERKGATSTVRCLDVAALVAAAILRRNPSAEAIPFSDDVVLPSAPLNPFDSVMTNSRLLSQLPSGGTACSAPLRFLNARKARGDLVIYVSDNQSWADFMKLGPTAMAVEWERFWARNRSAKLVLIDLQPNPTTQVRDRTDVLNVGGFSDAVFDLISLFEKGELDPEHFVGAIRSVDIA
jgi:60 kDa SS-A/Ro ribonucleoprotein